MVTLKAARARLASTARRAAMVMPMLVLAACGEADADPKPSPQSGLTVTQPDGKSMTITPTSVECAPSEYDPDTEVVLVRDANNDYNLQVEVVPADVTNGKTFDLPVSAGDMQSGPANAFVFYGSKRFEVSTSQEESTGSLEVTTATCDPLAIDLTIDATLASEYFDGDSLQVQGRIALSG